MNSIRVKNIFLIVSQCQDNIRIDRCQIYNKEEYRGYIASKKRYFYGLRVHMLVNKHGKSIEFYRAAGSYNDVKV